MATLSLSFPYCLQHYYNLDKPAGTGLLKKNITMVLILPFSDLCTSIWATDKQLSFCYLFIYDFFY